MTVTVQPPQRVRHRRNSCDSHIGYVSGCGGCQARMRNAARHRTRMKAYGTWDSSKIDARPAREHIQTLTGPPHHMSQRQIARLAGVSKTSLALIASGDLAVAAEYTVTAICCVAPIPPADSLQRVPAYGTARRIQAFTADGFDAEYLAALLGVRGADVRRWRAMANPKVSATTACAVRDLFRRVGGASGPSGDARDLAARMRWARAMEWDDAAIDDPDASPPAWPDSDTVDERVVAEALRGRVPLVRLTTPERVLLYRLWCRQQQDAGLRAGGKPFGRAFGVGESTGLRIARTARNNNLPSSTAIERTAA